MFFVSISYRRNTDEFQYLFAKSLLKDLEYLSMIVSHNVNANP